MTFEIFYGFFLQSVNMPFRYVHHIGTLVPAETIYEVVSQQKLFLL